MALGLSGHSHRCVLRLIRRNAPDFCAQPRRFHLGRASRYGRRKCRAIGGLDGKPSEAAFRQSEIRFAAFLRKAFPEENRFGDGWTMRDYGCASRGASPAQKRKGPLRRENGPFALTRSFDYALDSAFSAVSSTSALAFCFSFFSFFFNLDPSNSRIASCAPSPMRKPA